MDYYIVKTKEVKTEEFYSILVYLTDDYTTDNKVNPENLFDRSLAWIEYDKNLKTELLLHHNNCDDVIVSLFNSFKQDYSIVIKDLNKITTPDKIEEMLYLIEMFIADTCIQFKNKLFLEH